MLLFCLYYLDVWGGIDTCPTCLTKRQEEQEKLESKFLELKEKNLESKAILLLRFGNLSLFLSILLLKFQINLFQCIVFPIFGVSSS
jgi:hypothetical protein